MLRSPARVSAVVVGAALLVLGVAGAVATASDPTHPEDVLGLFAANLAQATVHLVLGAALIGTGAISGRVARVATQVGGSLLLALGVAGLFLVDTGANVLALGASDNLLHFCAAALLLTVGFGATTRARTSPPRAG